MGKQGPMGLIPQHLPSCSAVTGEQGEEGSWEKCPEIFEPEMMYPGNFCDASHMQSSLPDSKRLSGALAPTGQVGTEAHQDPKIQTPSLGWQVAVIGPQPPVGPRAVPPCCWLCARSSVLLWHERALSPISGPPRCSALGLGCSPSGSPATSAPLSSRITAWRSSWATLAMAALSRGSCLIPCSSRHSTSLRLSHPLLRLPFYQLSSYLEITSVRVGPCRTLSVLFTACLARSGRLRQYP